MKECEKLESVANDFRDNSLFLEKRMKNKVLRGGEEKDPIDKRRKREKIIHIDVNRDRSYSFGAA
jgi:hypothetical protein